MGIQIIEQKFRGQCTMPKCREPEYAAKLCKKCYRLEFEDNMPEIFRRYGRFKLI